MEGGKRVYLVENPEQIEIEYDRQSDILYIYFSKDIEDADEELLSEDGDTAFRIKEGKIVSIMVMNFSNKLGGVIL